LSAPAAGGADASRVALPGATALLAAACRIAREAGAAILGVDGQADRAVRHKADASPLTLADERAEAIIVPALRSLAPYPVVVEEAVARGECPAIDADGPFWLVDPLDGTREFVARNGEFTVNIALVCRGAPLLGVVHVPVAGISYAGQLAHDGGNGAPAAWIEHADGRHEAIACRACPAEGLVLAVSRSHGDDAALQAWLGDAVPVAGRIAAGSALKFGLLARGAADLYPRLGRTMEWDTAAGHALLRAAGGDVLDLQGQPLRYGKPGFENPPFVAHGRGWQGKTPRGAA
jgi:3'(2'), 5'-bisphosphate nucleotidase